MFNFLKLKVFSVYIVKASVLPRLVLGVFSMALVLHLVCVALKRVTMHIKNCYIITGFKYFTKFDIQKSYENFRNKIRNFSYPNTLPLIVLNET